VDASIGMRFHVWFNIAGWVDKLSGDNIPKLILDKKSLRGLHPVMKVVFIEFSEGKRWKLWKLNVEIGRG